jgi:short-subunit dehydrogenase
MVVASMAALYPVPYQAAYSATKAFLLSFTNALSHEIKNPQFSVTAYVPAGIATEMTGGDAFHGLQSWLMPVKQAATEGLDAFIRRRYSRIPGVMNRLGSMFMHLLPKKFIAGQMGKIYYKSLLQSEAGSSATPTKL